MTWAFESPLYILLFGGITAAILFGGWYKTSRTSLMLATAAAVVLTGILLVVEQTVVTDREEVEETLYRIAAEVQNNNVEKVLTYIHSDAAGTLRQAANELPHYDFERVTIKPNMKVTVDRSHIPPQAVAEFNVVVVLSRDSALVGSGTYPRFVEVTLYEEDGRWKVREYNHFDFREGLRRRD